MKRNFIKYLDLDAANRPGDTDSDLVASKYCTRSGLNFKMGWGVPSRRFSWFSSASTLLQNWSSLRNGTSVSDLHSGTNFSNFHQFYFSNVEKIVWIAIFFLFRLFLDIENWFKKNQSWQHWTLETLKPLSCWWLTPDHHLEQKH